MTVKDTRLTIVSWASKWGVGNKRYFQYSKGPERMDFLKHQRGYVPLSLDCSAAVTLWYWAAGAQDPNGLHYDGEGYTGTLLSNGVKIGLKQLQPADVIVYGPGTGVHAVLVVDATNKANPLCVSMGEDGDPSFVRHSVLLGLGEPTFLRYHTGTTGPVYNPPAVK